MKYRKYFSIVLFVSIFFFFLSIAHIGDAANDTQTWSELLQKRSSSIFTESIDLGGLRVGGRGKIIFTWLDRGLLRVLERNNNVNEGISAGLGYYYANKPEVSKLIKNRDIFLLSYHAYKRWDFKIEEIVINGYRLTMDDILTSPYYRVLGELPPLRERERDAEYEEDLDDYQLHVAVPSLPKRGKIKLSYGEDTVEWEIPKR